VRHPSALAAVTLAVAGLAVAGCGSSASSSSTTAAANAAPAATTAQSTSAYGATSSTTAASSSASATVVVAKHDKLGTILAAGPKRLTVYMFEGDKGSTSTCSGACAQVWPPVTTTGAALAHGSANASALGTITRSDGTTQVTYKGHPLYYFARDKDDGDAYGEGVHGFGADWYVLTPQGNKVDES
jgi:predicted lipoprotein with Yx(FWY)xxD motif